MFREFYSIFFFTQKIDLQRDKANIVIYDAPGYFLKIMIFILLSFEGIALP